MTYRPFPPRQVASAGLGSFSSTDAVTLVGVIFAGFTAGRTTSTFNPSGGFFGCGCTGVKGGTFAGGRAAIAPGTYGASTYEWRTSAPDLSVIRSDTPTGSAQSFGTVQLVTPSG